MNVPPVGYATYSETSTCRRGGDFTPISASVPISSTSAIPTIPIRSENKAVNSVNNAGANGAAALPVVAYRPNISPSRPTGATRARKARELA